MAALSPHEMPATSALASFTEVIFTQSPTAAPPLGVLPPVRESTANTTTPTTTSPAAAMTMSLPRLGICLGASSSATAMQSSVEDWSDDRRPADRAVRQDLAA